MASVVSTGFPPAIVGDLPSMTGTSTAMGRRGSAVRVWTFQTSPTSFRALVHRTANARGMKAETTINKYDKSVTFRFFEAP
jgi:hypothetical protein